MFGNPGDINCEGQFVMGTISLDQQASYDFIDFKWNTFNILSLRDSDLPMPKTLQVSRWKKSKVRKMFKSSNSYFRIVAYNPYSGKVKSVTNIYNLQDEVLSLQLNLDETVVHAIVQPPQLEVIVSGDQHTVTFNEEPVLIEGPSENKQ